MTFFSRGDIVKRSFRLIRAKEEIESRRIGGLAGIVVGTISKESIDRTRSLESSLERMG